MNILNEIILLDRQAQARADSALKAEQKRTAEVGNAAAKASAEKVKNEREKTEKLRAKQEKTLSEKLSGAEKVKAERCREIDKIFSENKSRWKSEIIHRITEE